MFAYDSPIQEALTRFLPLEYMERLHKLGDTTLARLKSGTKGLNHA